MGYELHWAGSAKSGIEKDFARGALNERQGAVKRVIKTLSRNRSGRPWRGSQARRQGSLPVLRSPKLPCLKGRLAVRHGIQSKARAPTIVLPGGESGGSHVSWDLRADPPILHPLFMLFFTVDQFLSLLGK